MSFEDTGGWRARADFYPHTLGVGVQLAQRLGDSSILWVQPTTLVVERRDGEAALAYDGRPSLAFTEGQARAILDALASYFGGTAEVLTQRQDYLAERARVDKLINALIERR